MCVKGDPTPGRPCCFFILARSTPAGRLHADYADCADLIFKILFTLIEGLRSLRKSARIEKLNSQNLVQGERKPSLLEFAEPQPRFNEVTLNSRN